ncbi:hypothetical protein [Gracilibacillus xinjiangensis]|uniref:Uncharacterized protein n=1 Tax=Gracilibacillus xinjiangensis TaxID=1193282 RepID=A0ABV8WZD8_9BACI
MWNETWSEIVRVMDLLMITMQQEMIMIIFTVGLLLIGYYLLYPFIRLVIALEWGSFLTFLFVSILGIWLMNHLVPDTHNKYYLNTIIIFSLCVCIKRLVTIFKMRAKN